MTTANPWAGEVALVLDGERQVLRLTLGALAELEDQTGASGLVELIGRFESGTFRAGDVIALLIAGLRGGGWRGSVDSLAKAEIEGGAIEATRVAAALLGRAFALPSA